MTQQVTIVFTNEDTNSDKFWNKVRVLVIKNSVRISWQATFAFSTGLTAAQRKREEEMETEKRGGEGLSSRCEILVLPLHIENFCLLTTVFNYLYFRNCVWILTKCADGH